MGAGSLNRPKLLYVTPVVPNVTGNGLAMRAGAILEVLAERYDVHLLIVPLYASASLRLPDHLEKYCCRSAIVWPHQDRCSRWYRACKWADVHFDVVHVFRLAATPFAEPYLHRWFHRPRRHLDLDDIESITRRRLADLYRQNGDMAAAEREELDAERQEAAENEALRTFDRVYLCSPQDREKLEGRGRAELCVLPNAVRIPESIPDSSGVPFSFLFVGTLGYYPNDDAARYLCRQIVPRLRTRAVAPFEVTIAGTAAPAALQEAIGEAGVRYAGAPEDLRPTYQQASAVVAPVRAGGGTRIKILEAFSYRRPVVATSIAIEGIDAEAGTHVLIGDTAEQFAEQCAVLIHDRAVRERLAGNAFSRLLECYSIESLKKSYARLD